jgi:hypothetical protein
MPPPNGAARGVHDALAGHRPNDELASAIRLPSVPHGPDAHQHRLRPASSQHLELQRRRWLGPAARGGQRFGAPLIARQQLPDTPTTSMGQRASCLFAWWPAGSGPDWTSRPWRCAALSASHLTNSVTTARHQQSGYDQCEDARFRPHRLARRRCLPARRSRTVLPDRHGIWGGANRRRAARSWAHPLDQRPESAG